MEIEDGNKEDREPHRAEKAKARRIRGDGSAVMRKAANEVLITDGSAIAGGLADRSKKGHVQSVRLLMELAIEEMMLRAAKSKKKKRSLAAEWGLEREWPRPAHAVAIEIGFVGAEQE